MGAEFLSLFAVGETLKVAVLADIHSNICALERVVDHIEAWRPDVVVMGGDVVNRGPQPLACWQNVEEKRRREKWQFVRGNHEDYVLEVAGLNKERSGPTLEIIRNALWTYERLGKEVSGLEAMPFQVSFSAPNGEEFRVVHASMRGNRDGIFPKTTDARLRRQIAPPPAVLCVGHTHRPLIRKIDNTLVVNVGSVGMPFDGDRRAAYAQLVWHKGHWKAEIIRLAYDWERTDRAFCSSGFLAEAGDLGRLMLLEFRQARSHIHLWVEQFEARVRAGEVSMAESVDAYLSTYS